jgi:TrmH family RNA methyltransferase
MTAQVPLLQHVEIVLIETSHPGNIGAAARAMKTMGLERLTLVRPRFFPHEEADARATRASDLLDRARVAESLDEALSSKTLVIGLTARSRELSQEMLSVREASFRAAQESLVSPAEGDAPIAIVFGNETSGLSNAEAGACDILANIPTAPEFGSLNLGAAVQVVAYELRQAFLGDTPLKAPSFPAASHDDVEGLIAHLEEVLLKTRFLNPDKPKKLLERLRRLIMRSRLEFEEVNLLRGLLKSFDLTLARHDSKPSLSDAEKQ